MIPNYINQWLKIIEDMHNDNTYKLAFGRALIENIIFSKYEVVGENVVIDFDDISQCMLKYYWNQIFYFNLKQAPYANKEPVICQDTKILIELYNYFSHNEGGVNLTTYINFVKGWTITT